MLGFRRLRQLGGRPAYHLIGGGGENLAPNSPANFPDSAKLAGQLRGIFLAGQFFQYNTVAGNPTNVVILLITQRPGSGRFMKV